MPPGKGYGMGRNTEQKRRNMGKEGMGGPGDLRDRFRDVYKPGANKAPEPGFINPKDGLKKIGELFKKKRAPSTIHER